MQKTVILNFANDKGNYYRMQDRLIKSLESVGYRGHIWAFRNEKVISEDCPLHSEIPYAFKAHAIKRAIDEGYEKIIWADSAVYAVKSIDSFLSWIDIHGYVFFKNFGFTVGDYTSDDCLNKFGWTRQKAFDNDMIMACLFGLNMKNKKAKKFFDIYYKAAMDGSYLGAWTNNNGEVSEDMRVKGHRHDQSVASIAISDLKMEMIPGQKTFFAYTEHKKVMEIDKNVCFFSQGI
jgi:hypothetical protein